MASTTIEDIKLNMEENAKWKNTKRNKKNCKTIGITDL